MEFEDGSRIGIPSRVTNVIQSACSVIKVNLGDLLGTSFDHGGNFLAKILQQVIFQLFLQSAVLFCSFYFKVR